MQVRDAAQLQHENLLAWLRVCGRQVPGALIRERRGVAVVATGLPFTLFNRILVTQPGASLAELADAVVLMRDRGAPFSLDLRRGTDDGFAAAAVESGLVCDSDAVLLPGMVLTPILPTGDGPSGLKIRRVVDQPGLELHCRALADGYGIPDSFVRPIMTPAMLADADLAIYVGLAEGQPVVSGFGVRTGHTIGVYNIATLPAARGRGFGAAMTTRIANDGAAAGCDVAILQASEMGLPMYRRLGYRTVVEYESYELPGTEPGARID